MPTFPVELSSSATRLASEAKNVPEIIRFLTKELSRQREQTLQLLKHEKRSGGGREDPQQIVEKVNAENLIEKVECTLPTTGSDIIGTDIENQELKETIKQLEQQLEAAKEREREREDDLKLSALNLQAASSSLLKEKRISDLLRNRLRQLGEETGATAHLAEKRTQRQDLAPSLVFA